MNSITVHEFSENARAQLQHHEAQRFENKVHLLSSKINALSHIGCNSISVTAGKTVALGYENFLTFEEVPKMAELFKKNGFEVIIKKKLFSGNPSELTIKW